MTVQHRRAGLPLFAVALAVFAWGFGPLFVKGIDASFNTIVFWRVLIGTVVAVAFAYLVGGRITLRLVVVAFPAGVCFALSFIFGFASFQETSIVNATLLPALQPVLILFLATRMFGERRSGVELAYAGLALAGVVVVVAGASSDGASLEGNLFAVLNLLVFTAYFLLGKRAPRCRRPRVVVPGRGVHRRVRGGPAVGAASRRTTSAPSRAPTGCCCADSSCSRAWSAMD